jgi:hypothetical protein
MRERARAAEISMIEELRGAAFLCNPACPTKGECISSATGQRDIAGSEDVVCVERVN